MNTSRRGFLKALGALGAGLIVAPIEPLIVPERKKIWVVGAQLERAPAKTFWFDEVIWSRVGSEEFLARKQLQDLAQHAALNDKQQLMTALARRSIPARQGLTILPADEPRPHTIGWVMESLASSSYL